MVVHGVSVVILFLFESNCFSVLSNIIVVITKGFRKLILSDCRTPTEKLSASPCVYIWYYTFIILDIILLSFIFLAVV